MAGNVKGIIVEIGGDTSALQKALAKVNKSTASLSRELRGVNSLLKLDPKNTEMVAQKQTLLKKNIEETSAKLEQLKEVQKQADDTIAKNGKISEDNYRSLQREIAATQNKLNNLKAEASNWTQAGKAIEEWGNKISNISSKINGVGTTLSTKLTLPIAAIATAAIKTGTDFEKQMSRVQAIAGATKDELGQLTDQAIDLGAKTSFGATDVAEAMENLASAGFNTNEIMAAVPGLLDLAASSGAELGTSAEITASTIRGFGLEADKSAHIADVFAEAAARTNAQTEDMGEAMKYVAPVAKTVGLSVEETAAAIGIMSDAGVKGSQAGTTLRGGLTRIIKPTKQVKDAMNQLGVSFYDSDGKMKSLTEIIQTLQDHTKGLSDETKNQALAQIFGTEALSGMLALVNRGSGELDSMTKSFENCDGAASKMADTMLDNTAGSIEEMKGALESAGIAIQRALAPQIRDLAKKAETLVNKFNDLSDKEKKNILKIVELVAVIGPAVKIFGTFGSAIGKGTTAVGTFIHAIGLIGRTSTAEFAKASTAVQGTTKFLTGLISPIGLTTVAVTALAGALFYVNQKHKEAVQESQNFGQSMADAKQSMADYRTEVDNSAGSELSHIEYVKSLKNELANLVDENGKVKEGYKDRVSFILNELNNALGTEYNLNGDVVQSYKDIQSSIDETIEKKEAEIRLNASQEKYADAIKNQEQAVKDLKEAQDNLGMSYEEAKKKYEEYMTLVNDMQLHPTHYTDEERSRVMLQAEEMENLKNYIDAYDNANRRVKGYTQDIKNYEADSANFLSGKYTEVGNTIKATTQDWTSSSLQQIQQSISEQGKSLSQYTEMYRQTGNDVANQQAQQAEASIASLADELVRRTSTMTELGPQETAAWKALAEQDYGVYSEKVSLMGPETQKAVQNATGVLASNTPQMQEKARQLGEQTVAEFDKSPEARQNALNNISGFLNGLDDKNKRELLKQCGIKDVDAVINELDRGDLSEESGKNILNGLFNGLSNGSIIGKILNKAAGLASSVNDEFKSKWQIGSPSRLMKKYAEFYLQPISTVMKNRKKSIVSTAKNLATSVNNEFGQMAQVHDFGNLQGRLSNKIEDKTKTIYTTPNLTIYTQEFDAKKIAKEVNKVFGSQY